MKFLGDDRLQTLLSVRWLTALAVSVVTVIVTHGIACAEWVWPQEVAGKEGKLTIYQPQLELFKADKVNARAAIAVQRKGEKELVFGVFWFSARVVVDRDTRTVEFADVKADNMKFSNEVTEEDRLLAQSLVSQMTAKSRMSMSLDRFLSMTTAFEREKAESDELGTEPPKIIFATSSSVLVIVNGKPILRNVEGTNLQRVDALGAGDADITRINED